MDQNLDSQGLWYSQLRNIPSDPTPHSTCIYFVRNSMVSPPSVPNLYLWKYMLQIPAAASTGKQ